MTAPLYLEWECDKRPLAANILEAADRLHARESLAATVALVHPDTLMTAGDIAIDGITVKPSRYVRRGFVMVGVEDATKLISLAHVAIEQGRLI
jgi:hypothetical protein